ncbi:hypothetical protein STVA_01120 [Allostella vacuolata]|nr:hypothetical protein STVA_01120 [Stella vacuolata]
MPSIWRATGQPQAPVSAIDYSTGFHTACRWAGRLSYRHLHKWNFLRPLGQMAQNLAIASTALACLIVMGIFGIRLDLRRRRRRASGLQGR